MLLFTGLGAFAQEADTLLVKLKKTALDTNRVNVQLDLAYYYLFKDGLNKTDVDSCLYYVHQARELARSLDSKEHIFLALLIDGQLILEQKDFKGAEIIFSKVADYYHSVGDKANEALVWDIMGESIGFYGDLSNYEQRLRSFQKSRKIYLAGNYELLAAQELNKVANTHLSLGNQYQAEIELGAVIEKFKELKYPKIYQAHYLLAEVYDRKRDNLSSLFSRIECVKAFDADKNRVEVEGYIYYQGLAEHYMRYEKYAQSAFYYQKTLDLAEKFKDRLYYYRCLRNFIKLYEKQKNHSAGLLLLEKVSKKFPPSTDSEKQFMLSSQLVLHNYLKDSKATEKIIPEFKQIFMKWHTSLKKTPDDSEVNTFVYLYNPLLDYYLQNKQWDKLALELNLYDKLKSRKLTRSSQISILRFKFRLDSLHGNFLSAFKSIQQIRNFNDSLNAADLKAKPNEFDAQLLSIKKEQAIKELNSRATLQNIDMVKINKQRNITLVGILVAIVIASLLYVGYKSKQRVNNQLQQQQIAINDQNNSLSALLTDKEKLIGDLDNLLNQQRSLITDKEWLLKEVHHRVKNNLQIVMSLLYNQSAYLKNPAAIEALKDSQNRVHAISIIHQKLYSKTNVATLVMAEYIKELVHYLRDGYDTGRMKIKFIEEMDLINLNIAQAVPLGLIVNEAVTNSIKYAFLKTGGDIRIEGRLIAHDIVSLTVADNGVGLPPDFDINKTTSLGMEMMKALSKQLGGTFDVSTNAGVKITIQFTIDKSVKALPDEEPHRFS
ncbi:hypothetical protein GCM10023149_24400 [Mucilaginibacter gynuensis]|uniref:histidine kinase n=2 Tax=Mucilaginibacter gynuensis TaxID=1302236 RepID=A0ABP8GG44_9SPHI